MDPNGEHARKLYASENGSVGQVQWSRDGQRVVYLERRENEKDETETTYSGFIESRDLKGSPPITVFSAIDLQDFSWLPDGRIIYISGDYNYWEVQTGEANPKPKRLTNWAGFSMGNISCTADGKRLAFLRGSYSATAYVADFDASRTRITVPRRLSLAEAEETPTGWTADGKAVIFKSNRNGPWELLKQPVDADTAEIVATAEGDENTPLSPDGRWFLYRARYDGDPSTPNQLMRVPAAGGSPELILTADFSGIRCARTLCAIMERDKARRQLVFTDLDPVKGRGRELSRFDVGADLAVWYDWAISPDSTHIAVLEVGGRTIHVLSLRGQPEQLIHPKEWSGLEALSWDADGKGLLSSSSTQRSAVLLYIDLQGNTQVLWEQRGRVRNRLLAFPSPGGHHLAISGEALNSNVWMIQNF